MSRATHSTVAVIGAGFGGIGLGYYLAAAGITDYTIFEKAADLGGTWRENTYPGAACDVPSNLYCYSFERHYPWRHRYGKQAEIMAYINHCADKYDVRRHIRFGHEVAAAAYDEADGIWTLQFAGGSLHTARILVSAVGQLNRPAIPAIPGRAAYSGHSFHSARWDHDVDLTGKTVAVIGNGASAVQLVPAIADRVGKLYVFQRSPGWVWPKHETAVSPRRQRMLQRFPILRSLERWSTFLQTELLAYAYSERGWVERMVTRMAEKKLREGVADPVMRARLHPDFPIGCKRMLLTSDWLPTLARPDVELVTDTLERYTETGLRTIDQVDRAVDVVIWATGFETTRFLAPISVRGAAGRTLEAQWIAGAEAYLGVAATGFPNLFMLFGPNTNTSGSILFMLEQQQRYIARVAAELLARGARSIEVRAEAQCRFISALRERSARSTYEANCSSWYKNEAGTNTNNWIGTQREYRRRMRDPQWSDYCFSMPGCDHSLLSMERMPCGHDANVESLASG